MTRRSPLPHELSDLPFSRIPALRAGVSAGRLRASDLSRPFRGVRAATHLPSGSRWLARAYQEKMHPGHAFSHVTAALLYGLPLPMYVETESALHVAAPAPMRAPAGVRVVGHRVSSSVWAVRELVQQDLPSGHLFAFPIVEPRLLWAQLAPMLAVDDLVALGDAIVGGQPPLGSVEELQRTAREHAGRRGAKRMAVAVRSVRVGSLSRPESLLRLILVRAGFPEPALNLHVEDQLGRPIAMADLCWPEWRVLVEYEGDGHRTSRGQFRRDITRGERYQDGGWFQLRASADDVFGDPRPFVVRLERRLRERGWRPGLRELRHVAGARR